jgi:Tfp pilus assembly protein PilP
MTAYSFSNAAWVVPLFTIVINGSLTQASNIHKPASALPTTRAEESKLQKPIGSSKSTVVPVRRKINVAIGNLQKSSPTSSKPKGSSKVQSVKKSPSITTLSRNQSNSSELSVETPSLAQNEAVWDSANKRYDNKDPASAITQGVTVDEIIEPSVDYRYSSARRKNPFIPEIILTGQIARQRELSPNDVEIPIVSPLQAYAVSQLSVMGVWETENRIWKALIGTPANHGIEAKLGDPVGSSGGRIMSITPESVIVREFSVRVDGTREYRDIPLHMGSEAPGAQVQNDKVGGRLILRPGASQPEIVSPDKQEKSSDDLFISNSSVVVPTEVPGVLKTIERTQLNPNTDGAGVSGFERNPAFEQSINAGKIEAVGLPNQLTTPSGGGVR